MTLTKWPRNFLFRHHNWQLSTVTKLTICCTAAVLQFSRGISHPIKILLYLYINIEFNLTIAESILELQHCNTATRELSFQNRLTPQLWSRPNDLNDTSWTNPSNLFKNLSKSHLLNFRKLYKPLTDFCNNEPLEPMVCMAFRHLPLESYHKTPYRECLSDNALYEL